MKYPFFQNENLKSKFDAQMTAVKELGYQVYYIGWDGKGMYLCNEEDRILIRKTALSWIPNYYHTVFFKDLYSSVNNVVYSKPFDLIYMRSMPAMFPYQKMMENINRQKIKLIIEIPTYPIEREMDLEQRKTRRMYISYSNKIKEKTDKNIDLYTLIGEKTNGIYRGKKAINIVNGVDLTRIPLRSPNYDESTINLLALASMCYWHGYDRLIYGMKMYSMKHKVKVHMVGNDGDGSLKKWMGLVKRFDLQDYFIFHGALYGEKLNEMFSLCDIGVGSLGLYRTGFQSGSNLKTREYLARGLPFIYAAEDPILSTQPEYCLKVPNDGEPINMQDVCDFALNVKHNQNIIYDMRRLAIEKLNWTSQFEKILSELAL